MSQAVRVAHARACYEIVESPTFQPGARPTPLVIRDVGPHDKHRTVTNDAENVVAELHKAGLLDCGRKLFYFDSAGDLDEIVHEEGVFWGFRSIERLRGGRRNGKRAQEKGDS